MPSSCLFLFTFKDSLINGSILLEFILTNYIVVRVLINEVKRKRPNSDLAEILHDVFLSPKIVLQYLVCIFSYDVLSSSDKVSQVLLFYQL